MPVHRTMLDTALTASIGYTVLTSVLGIAGSIGATYLGQALGLYPEGRAAGFVASVIGAMLLLVAYHFVARNSAK